MRWTGIAAATAAGVLSAGVTAACGSGPAGLDVSSATTQPGASTTAAPTSSATPSASTPPPSTAPKPVTPEAPWVVVNFGSWAGDPVGQLIQKYGDARTRAVLSYNAELPAFVAITTQRWRTFQGDAFASAKKKGWTVPRPAKYAILGLSHVGTGVRVRVCMWNPSTGWRDVRTGKWAELVTNSWAAYDFRFVPVTGGWKVDYVYDGTFSCKGAR